MDTLAQVIFWLWLMLTTASAVYQLLCLYSGWLFFRAEPDSSKLPSFTPPVSVLKPLRGSEEWMYDALASFCVQDYPDYKIIFGVRYFFLLPVRDLLSFAVWVVSFFGNTVYWCGDLYRLQSGGVLEPVKK